MSMNSSTKKSLTIISIVGAIVIAALLIYVILMTPARQPYRDALAQYKNVYNANVQLTMRGSSLGASTATDEQFTNNVKTAKDGIRSLGVENDALAKEEVLKTGEGRALYDSFTKRLTAYMQYNSEMLDSVQQLRPILYGCSKLMGSASADTASVEALRSCAVKFRSLDGVADADYKAYAQISAERYDALAANLEVTAALTDPEGVDSARAEELKTELQGIVDDMTDDGSALAKGLSAHKQAVDITETAMALDAYLQAKSSIF